MAKSHRPDQPSPEQRARQTPEAAERPPENPGLTRSARVTASVVSAIIAIVMIGTVLMVMPAGTPLRSEVRAVAAPVFSQSWRVFAPNILKVDRTLEFRAQWRDEEGELVRSDWVSITDIESNQVKGNLAPSRVQKNSWNASNTLQQRYNALDEDQRKRVRDTFIQRAGDDFEPIPVEQLIEELGEGESAVIRYLRLDYMMMRYVTLYATAGFERDIERVQWRVVRERPNDFANRFSDESQFKPTITTYGWRQSNVRIDSEVIAEYRGLIERSGLEHVFRKAAADAE